MYELIITVKNYPKFLPWCDQTDVLETHANNMTTRLHLHYTNVQHAFTTRNDHVEDQSIVMGLMDDPFSMLDGTWHFTRLNTGERACKIEFDLRYAFTNLTLEALLNPIFDRIANTFIDSFVKRAEQIYRPR